jgi:hypothetical protein
MDHGGTLGNVGGTLNHVEPVGKVVEGWDRLGNEDERHAR